MLCPAAAAHLSPCTPLPSPHTHTAKDGTPVGVVPTSREEVGAQEVFTGAGVEEGVSTIPDKA